MKKLICLLNRVRYASRYKHCESGIEALSLAIKCGVSDKVLQDIALYHVAKIGPITEDRFIGDALDSLSSFIVGGHSGDYIDNCAFGLQEYAETLERGSREDHCAKAVYYAIWAARWEYADGASLTLVYFSYLSTHVSYAYHPDGRGLWKAEKELRDTVTKFIPSLI